MSRTSPAVIAGSCLIGAASGLRSQMGMAAVILGTSPEALPSKLRGKAVTPVAVTFALGELVVDKLPFTPKRTDPPGLAARIALGAWSGAILASSIARRGRTPAVVGASAAVGAAFAGMAVRARLSEHLPAVLVALGEDLLAASLAAEAVRIASGVPASG
jgi:uncharacterized membrane protein